MSSNFDETFYLNFYDDINSSAIFSHQPKNHYTRYGINEKRLPNLQAFIQRYPEFIIHEDIPVETMLPIMKNYAFSKINLTEVNRLIQEVHSMKNKKIEIEQNLSIYNPKIALLIHIGNYNVFRSDIHIYNLICNSGYHVDVYLTISDQTAKDKPISSLFKECKGQISQYFVENRGFDIGGFLFSLQKIKEQNLSYDYIIKSHTKSDGGWRRDLLNIFTNFYNVMKIMKDEKIGMICGTKRRAVIDNNPNSINGYHLHRLHKNILGTPFNGGQRYLFAAGTIFMARFAIFRPIFKLDINNLISNLNTEHTIDTNWYIHYNKLKITHEECQTHWETIGKASKLSGNVLARLKNPTSVSPPARDGMIEHAYERFFGMLVAYHKLELRGV